jgi:glycosyltransferase involved in cell wall biosynthesis
MLRVGESQDLAVIIPTRDRWDILARTLEALSKQTVHGFEVIVVVDGTDQTPPDLRPARVLTKEHGGPGAARNYAASQTDRPLVLFLGDDMIPDPDLVERHLQRHRAEQQREVGVLGLARWHPDLANRALHRWLDWSGMQFDYHTIRNGDAGWPRFYSCNVSLKRDFFLAAGGFDEEFIYYYEDLDAGYRLGERGLVLRFEPSAITRHFHRYDWSGIERRFVGVARGERMMARKHDWFEPWYHVRMAGAARQRRVFLPWQYVAPLLPQDSALRGRVERRATRRFLQRLAPTFLTSWDAAAEDATPSAQPAGGPSA